MPGPQSLSTLEYAMVAVIVCVGVVTLFFALAPILELILDGFKLLAAVFSGDLSGIGSLVPAAK